MKSNRRWLVPILVFIGVCVVLAGAIAFAVSRIGSGPPSQLTSTSGYSVRGSKVYFYPGFGLGEPFEISGADPKSFVIIDSVYGCDKARVYFDGAPIPGAEPSTFKVLEPPFARDANHVYVSGEVFSDDPIHFEQVEGDLYRDGRHIYWSTTPVSDDPPHLISLGTSGSYAYFKDSSKVFVNGNPIPDADPASFALIQDGYSRDATHVFYFDSAIPGADVSTFGVIQPPYARDASRVYWMQNPIPDADPATFRVLNADFKCSADAQRAYYQGNLIPSFDPASIPSGATVTNCDASGIYFSP